VTSEASPERSVRVPPVVAVVVTRDPGPWLEETLAALGAQDYPDLSVLVLDAASAEDPTPRVAAVLPDAFVRRLEHDGGFGANANHAIEMVHGAPLLLLCHDDVAPDPDLVHLLVEEAYRSNAGIVGPKHVGWVDPSRLLHVGLAVDKTGAVLDRVLPLELDHGQHDAVRDVFAVPGGCTLVRADLFAALGGFDPLVVGMGEDLDLCWRAHVAGARVVVAPAARVRHLELVAGGLRSLPVHDEPTPTLRELQRRHELYAALKAYDGPHLARIVPQALVLAAAEVVVALVTGDRQRAVAVVRAWRWNLRHLATVRSRRADVLEHRQVPDRDVRRLQVRGSARLTGYVQRATTYGLHLAHLDAEAIVTAAGAPPTTAAGGGGASEGSGAGVPEASVLEAGVLEAAATTEDQATTADRGTWSNRLRSVVSLAKDDVPDLQQPVLTAEVASRHGTAANRRLQLRAGAWLLVVLVGFVGSRSLLSAGFPAFGQILPLPSWSTLWHEAWAGWHPASGVGAAAAGSPGLALLGVLATVLFGAVGLARTVLFLGCLPVGAIGVVRLARSWDAPWARLVATVAYLALPVAVNDLATGSWPSLVVYAAVPWIVARLFRVGRIEPVGSRRGRSADVAAGSRSWRQGSLGQLLALGLVVAVAASLAPSVLAVTIVVAAGVALGTLAVGGWGAPRAALRILGVGVGAVLVACVLLLPWTVAVLSSSQRAEVLFGPRVVATAGSGVATLLRFSFGPAGHTPLAYGFLVAAALPLAVGGRWRLAWASRLWTLAAVCWLLTWLTGRGWTGPLSLPVGALLAPAGLALALGAGLAVATVEADLPRHRFGWRQGASVVGMLAVVACLVPSLGAVGSGRWDLPSEGWDQATAFMAHRQSAGQFRVLWLGTANLLPGASWPLEPGLAAAVSQGPVPTLTSILTVPDPGPLRSVATAIEAAQAGDTVQLGETLARFAIRYVVVAQALAPTVLGYQSPLPSTSPAGLAMALARQLDLEELSTESGYLIFEAPAAPPERAVVPAGSAGGPAADATPVLDGRPGADAFSGSVPAGTLQVYEAPAADWEAVGPSGQTLAATREGPAEERYTVPAREQVDLRFEGSWLHGVATMVELLLVLATAGLLAGRRWSVDWWWLTLRRRRSQPAAPSAAPTSASGASATAADQRRGAAS
jgi:GT2 family glycosyltransferase